MTNPDIAAVVKNSRSRSGSPATCYDITKFEKEKSPFLAVKSLLKPFKKCRVSEQPEGLRESSSGQTQDIRKLAGMLKSRGSRLKQNSKVDRQMHSLLSPGSQNSPWFSVIKRDIQILCCTIIVSINLSFNVNFKVFNFRLM